MPNWKLKLIKSLGGVPASQYNSLLRHYFVSNFEARCLRKEVSTLRARIPPITTPSKPYKVH
jgi:hypothetical protein